MVTKNEVRFTVPGEPVGKGRPRLSSRNGFAHAYTPAGTRKYEAMVRKLAGEEMERQGLAVTELPVYVSIAARYAIPKRHIASMAALGATRPERSWLASWMPCSTAISCRGSLTWTMWSRPFSTRSTEQYSRMTRRLSRLWRARTGRMLRKGTGRGLTLPYGGTRMHDL